jgi:translation initiation factor IF-2
MNVTELARILGITPQELRDDLPPFGFSIGQKAIKINRNVANRVVKEWPVLKKKIAHRKMIEEKEKQADLEERKKLIDKKIEIPNVITVRDFVQISGIQLNTVLGELMKNGIFASLNEKIDFDTAWLIGSELGMEVKLKEGEEKHKEDTKLKDILKGENEKNMLSRPPVIVVMGHVDHGKTKLLDAIRKTDVVAGEAGGITQHIGAYQVKRKGQLITFIDTPGHEAFTAMRSRGAKIADIAILVVAADDGVKPQTVEAFRIIEAAKIPYVVAINKVDKEGANIDKVKQELSSQLKIIPEDWGGNIVCSPISALKNEGIDDLLDMVLLSAETTSENIKANPNTNAIGTIIESHIDKGAGPIATILVQNGTLKFGDQLMLNHIHIGKVRNLKNYLGQGIKNAGPSSPVQIIGLKAMPKVGDLVEVGNGTRINYKKMKAMAKQESSLVTKQSSEEEDESIKKINLIIKSDVLGSAEAIEESLEKINTEEVKIKIVRKGLGNIAENDIKRAEAVNGTIISFNVKTPPDIQAIARERNIEIKNYSIIYDLINDMKEKIENIKDVKIVRVELGKLEVLALFRAVINAVDLNNFLLSISYTNSLPELGFVKQ